MESFPEVHDKTEHKIQHHYFISYQYKSKDNEGFGQVSLLLNEKVTRSEQIEQLVNYLKKNFKCEEVAIINIILLMSE